MSNPPPARRRLWLCSHARTTSSLFMRMLSQHPGLKVLNYPFHMAQMLGPERLMRRGWGDESFPRDHIKNFQCETYQVAFDRLQDAIAVAEDQV